MYHVCIIENGIFSACMEKEKSWSWFIFFQKTVNFYIMVILCITKNSVIPETKGWVQSGRRTREMYRYRPLWRAENWNSIIYIFFKKQAVFHWDKHQIWNNGRKGVGRCDNFETKTKSQELNLKKKSYSTKIWHGSCFKVTSALQNVKINENNRIYCSSR